MKVKKSLENRIRGWFPKEPRITIASLMVNTDVGIRQPPPIIPSEYKLSATRFTIGYGLFWIFFLVFQFFAYAGEERYETSGVQVLVWVIAGVMFGAILCGTQTKSQLRRLLKNYQIGFDAKEIILPIVSLILFLIVGFAVAGLSSHNFVSYISNLRNFTFSIYASLVSYVVTRVILLVTFEKKENMRVMQSWWRAGFVLIPKAPNSNQPAGGL